MLTTHELRVLYVLRKHGRPAKRSEITQAMHRFTAAQRQRALDSCENLELISSAKTPPVKGKGGPGGLVYWLTDAGKKYVQDMIDGKQMADPKTEPRRGRKGVHRAHS